MHGEPITLLGKELSIGDPAPDFLLLDTGKTKRSLKDYEGTIKLISAVPSLDTGVCDAQTRRFNKEAADFSDHVTVLTVSMDLPFAQSRWCGAAGIDRVITHRLPSGGQDEHGGDLLLPRACLSKSRAHRICSAKLGECGIHP